MTKRKHSSRKSGKGGKKFLGLTARAIMLLAAALLVLTYLSIFVNPAKFWFMTVIGLLFIPCVLLNLILLVWAIIRRSKSFVIPLVALLPCLFFIGREVQLFGGAGDDEDSEDSGDRISVVTYNVGRFAQESDGSGVESRGDCEKAIADYLAGTDADIICLQEVYSRNTNVLKEMLKTYFPSYHYEYYVTVQSNGVCGNVTLTRLPVAGKGKFNFEHSGNLALYTDLMEGDDTFRVYNCHFESYNISIAHLASSILGSDDSYVQESEVKMRKSITRRPHQVDEIVKDVNSSPTPSIITGDFNDSPMSYTYNALMKWHRDSFVEAGRGMAGTYSILWPFIRIDYVLIPKAWQGISHEVRKIKYSDHYPVEAGLVIPHKE